MEQKNGIPCIYCANAEQWRSWLEINHDKEKSVWLIIYHKKSKTPSVYYPEAVDQALCFGWIDSKPNKRDEESMVQFFSKRNPKSNWSRVNKEKVERLQQAGLMALAGLEMIQLAKETGTWTALDEVENLILPKDLEQAFAENVVAFSNFSNFSKSVKRGILEQLFNAKREETRQKRIQEIVSLAQENKPAFQFIRKQKE